MLVLIDGDSIPYVASYYGVKEKLTELKEFKKKVDSYLLAILQCVASSNYIMYLSGKDNFRYKIKAQKEYKANRAKGIKPLYIDELKQYLIDRYEAVLVDGCEADDALAMSHTFCNETVGKKEYITCIASMDKDLQQIPGIHLNIKTMTVTEVSQDEALRNLWRQVLTGDTSDNISGIEGCGSKCADNLLNGAKVEDYPKLVFNAYKERYGSDGERLFKSNYMLVKLITKNKYFKMPKIQNIDDKL